MNFKAKVARTVAAVGLVLVATTGIAFASAGTATVTASSLRLRSEANTSSSTLLQAPKGSTVTVEEDMGNGWYKVTYGSKTGYMSGEWLTVTLINTNTDTNTAAPIGTAVVTASSLRLRSEASTSSSTLSQVPKGSTVTVEEDAGNGWYKVTYGSKTGYMSGEWLTVSLNNGSVIPAASGIAVEKTKGLITTTLNVRSGAGTSYSVVSSLKSGALVDIVADLGNGWYQIKSGYICADYVTLVGADYQPSSAKNTSSGSKSSSSNSTSNSKSSSGSGSTLGASSSTLGASAAAMAKKLVGCSYAYGAAGPKSFDCSGLIYYIYKQLGHTIARGSSSQYYNSGHFVSTGNMQPGDLLFFYDKRYDSSGGALPTTHVGIYIGNDQFIHASTNNYKVRCDTVSGHYAAKLVGVKRIG